MGLPAVLSCNDENPAPAGFLRSVTEAGKPTGLAFDGVSSGYGAAAETNETSRVPSAFSSSSVRPSDWKLAASARSAR